MPTDIFIKNINKKIELKNESLLELLRNEGVDIKSSCGGHATCSDCVVKICSGDQNLSSVNFDEKKLLGNVYFITKERLACQVRCSDLANINQQVEIEIVNLNS